VTATTGQIIWTVDDWIDIDVSKLDDSADLVCKHVVISRPKICTSGRVSQELYAVTLEGNQEKDRSSQGGLFSVLAHPLSNMRWYTSRDEALASIYAQAQECAAYARERLARLEEMLQPELNTQLPNHRHKRRVNVGRCVATTSQATVHAATPARTRQPTAHE